MSVSIGELTGEISLEDRFSTALEGVGSLVEKVIGEMGGNFKAVAEAATLAAVSITAMAGTVLYLAEKGSEVNNLTASFDHLAGSIENADKIMESLRAGTAGTIGQVELLQFANRALSTGAIQAADDFGKVAAAARVLSHEGLGSVEQELTNIERALATGHVRQLQYQTGVIDLKKAETEYAASLGITSAQLSPLGKQHADQIAIFDALNKKVKEAGDIQLSFAERIKAVNVSIGDWFIKIAQAVAESPHLTAAFDAIGNAITKNFGGAGETAIQTIVGWVNKFADAVATYGPPVIEWFGQIASTVTKYGPVVLDWLETIAGKIVDIWHAVQSAWDAVPDWFKRIAVEAALTGVAIGSVNTVTKSLTGSDILSNLASIAQIWSVIPNLSSKVAGEAPKVVQSVNSIYDSFVLFFTLVRGVGPVEGGIAGYFANLGAAVGEAGAIIAASPLFIAATWTVVILGAFKVGEAFGGMYNAWKESGSMWEYFGKGGGFWDESIIGRWLGMSNGAKMTADEFHRLADEAERLNKPLFDIGDKYQALAARDIAGWAVKGTEGFSKLKAEADALSGSLPSNITRMENLNTVLSQMGSKLTPSVMAEAVKDIKSLNIEAEKLPPVLRAILEAQNKIDTAAKPPRDITGDINSNNAKVIAEHEAMLKKIQTLEDESAQAIAKTEGDSLGARMAALDTWYNREYASIYNSKASWADKTAAITQLNQTMFDKMTLAEKEWSDKEAEDLVKRVQAFEKVGEAAATAIAKGLSGQNVRQELAQAGAQFVQEFGTEIIKGGELISKSIPIPRPPQGLLEQGNLDLLHRPQVPNPEGGISTVLSMGIEVDNKEVLIPRVNLLGQILTAEQAIAAFTATHQHLGIFDTPEHADAYAKALHEQQAALLGLSQAEKDAIGDQKLFVVASTDAADSLEGASRAASKVSADYEMIVAKVPEVVHGGELISTGMGEYSRQASLAADSAENLAGENQHLVTGLPLVGTAIKNLSSNVDIVGQTFDETGQKMEDAADRVNTAVTNAANVAKDAFKGPSQETQDWITKLQVAGLTIEQITAFLQKLKVNVSLDQVATQVNASMLGLKTNLEKVFEGLPKTLIKAFEGGGDFVGAFKALAVQIGDTFLTTLEAKFKLAAQDAIKTKQQIDLLSKSTLTAAAGIGAVAGGVGAAQKNFGTGLAASGVAAGGVVSGAASSAFDVGGLSALFSAKTLTSMASLGATTLGVGAAVAAVTIGIKALFNIGGPSKTELAGRSLEKTFQDQFKSIDDLTMKIGEAYATTGKTLQQAQIDVKALLDAEKQGPAAVQAIIDKLQGALDQAKKIDDAISGLGIKSHSELMATAQTLEQAYEKIHAGVATGEFTVQDETKAYIAFQQALADAGDEGAKAWLKIHGGEADAMMSMEDIAKNAGYQTKQALQDAADQAKRLFEYMRDSGQFTAADIEDAFKKAQDAAMKAAGISQELLDKQKSLQDSISQEAPEAEMGVIEKQQRAQLDAVNKQIDAAMNGAQAQADAQSWAADQTKLVWNDTGKNLQVDMTNASTTASGISAQKFNDAANSAQNDMQSAATVSQNAWATAATSIHDSFVASAKDAANQMSAIFTNVPPIHVTTTFDQPPVPKFDVPTATIPTMWDIQQPKIDVPAVTIPTSWDIMTPKIDVPTVTIPTMWDVTVPTITVPTVTIPTSWDLADLVVPPQPPTHIPVVFDLALDALTASIQVATDTTTKMFNDAANTVGQDFIGAAQTTQTAFGDAAQQSHDTFIAASQDAATTTQTAFTNAAQQVHDTFVSLLQDAATVAGASFTASAQMTQTDFDVAAQQVHDAWIASAQDAAKNITDTFAAVHITIPISWDVQPVPTAPGAPTIPTPNPPTVPAPPLPPSTTPHEEAVGEVGYAPGPMTFTTKGHEFFAFGREDAGLSGLASKISDATTKSSRPLTIQVNIGGKTVKEVLVDELETSRTNRDIKVLNLKS